MTPLIQGNLSTRLLKLFQTKGNSQFGKHPKLLHFLHQYIPFPLDCMQVHRSETPTGLELGSPPSSPLVTPSTTLPTVDVMSDSSEFDKYKDFPMEPTEMYARIDKLKGFRRSKKSQDSSSGGKKRRWGLGKRVKPVEEEEGDRNEVVGEEEEKSGRNETVEVDGREGIRKAFSSVLNLLSQAQVPNTKMISIFFLIPSCDNCFFEAVTHPLKMG